jgi:hypothetical protein
MMKRTGAGRRGLVGDLRAGRAVASGIGMLFVHPLMGSSGCAMRRWSERSLRQARFHPIARKILTAISSDRGESYAGDPGDHCIGAAHVSWLEIRASPGSIKWTPVL